MPVISKEVQRDTVFTDDTHKQIASITEIAVPTVHRDNETAMSIDLNSLIRAGATEWLDFTTEDFNKENTGIHVAGCGKFPALDSVWVYNKVVKSSHSVAPARMSELRSMLIAVSLSRCTVALRFR